MMKVTVSLFCGLLVGLVAAEWKDNIPPAKDFLEPALLSKLVFEVNSFEELEKVDDFEAVAFEETGSNGETEVAIVRSHRSRSILVGFRGTNVEELADIAANVNALQSDFFGLGRVHRGFRGKLLEDDLHIKLKDDLLAELQEYPDYEVILTGHSQGAALATLFGAWLVGTDQLGEQRRVTAIPFGSPRVASPDFKDSIRSLSNYAIYRIVNEEDIVCRLPGSFLNYRHVGHLFMVDFETLDSKAFFEQTGDGKKFRGVNGEDWDLTIDWRDLGDWVVDHSIGDYIAAVELSVEGEMGWPGGFESVVTNCSWWQFWCW